jgi:hypothetical protein
MDEILVIEDDRRISDRLNALLGSTYKVHVAYSADDGPSVLYGNLGVTAVVLDIMMDSPTGIPEDEVNGNLDTGIWILHEMAEFLIGRKVPVLIYSNRFLDDISHKLAALNFPQAQLEFQSKQRLSVLKVPGQLFALVGRRFQLPGLTRYESLQVDADIVSSLTKSGFGTSAALLNAAGPSKERARLSSLCGVPIAQLTALVQRIDFARVGGIGPRLAGLFSVLGIHSVQDLARQAGDQLHERLRRANSLSSPKIFWVPPSMIFLDECVKIAKSLEPLFEV